MSKKLRFRGRSIVCGVLIVGCALALRGQDKAQTPPGTSDTSDSYTPHLAFDIVSIHENREGTMNTIDNVPKSSIYIAENETLFGLILQAYGVRLFSLLTNVPSWAMTTRYDVSAKSDSETDRVLAKLSESNFRAEKRHMLQLMLADRFNLRIHEEQRMSRTYELVRTGRADKLMVQVAGEQRKTINTCTPHFSRKGREVDSRGCPFRILFDQLQQDLGTDVVDHTGMTGMYAYHFMHSPPDMTVRDGEEQYPSLVNAVADQLGLLLKPTRGMVKFWVVDHVEHPTPN